ncbi:MAG TPA: S1C family serine protease, partial [Stellaceae bacterium]|nr:S1C family serine protease [Stellaceae bacterium]
MMARPKPETYRFDLDAALSSVIGVQAQIPPDAFTASILGTDRAGNGVLIGTEGVVLTIGYLVTEADTVWLKAADGRAINGHVLAYDQETGFGLVQALGDLHAPVMALGQSAEAQVGDPVIIAGYGGRKAALEARIVAKQEFAGYWEYLLDEAFFTAPAHPDWGGAAVIGADGTLLGVGSLTVQQGGQQGGEQAGFGTEPQSLNMAVPIDLLKPILNDLMTRGRRRPPPRPWLGLYATEIDDRVV